jgi:signal transduction histidine kinase
MPAPRTPLDAGWAQLADPQEELKAQALTDPAVQARFQAFDGPPTLGYFKGAMWLRLTLPPQPGPPGERLLELQFPPIDEATLYWPGPDGLLPGRTAGDQHPLAQRDFAHRNIVYRVQVDSSQAQTFYLRLRGGNTFNFTVVLWEPSAFVSAALTEQLLWGMVLAVHLVLILSNLWFFQATRDAPHGLFALFAFTSFCSVLTLEGFGHRYLLDGWPAVNDALVVASWMLALPMSYFFALRYVGLLGPGERPWAPGLVWGLFGFAVAMILCDQLLHQNWPRALYSAVQMAALGLLVGLLGMQAGRGVSEARLTLAAMLPMLVAVVLRLGRNLGLWEPNVLFDHGYYLGLVLYLLILNFGISRRHEGLRQAAEAARAAALEAVQGAARQLEQRVSERTADIAAAMRQVQGALELERRLRSDQRQFIATMSHELRTPLAVIDTAAQNLALQKGAASEPATQARLQKVMAATDRMAALLNRHLQDDRLQDDSPGARVQPCELASLLQEAAQAARLLSEAHPVTVQLEGEGLDEPFVCDPTLTRMALCNLAENAVKYTPAGTRMLLSARRAGRRAADGVVLQVIDDGPGIAADDQVHLFQARFRGAATAGEVPGTGTGLLLSRRMIEVQGGTLDLICPAEGGTVATIWLPAAAQAQVRSFVQPGGTASMGSPKA